MNNMYALKSIHAYIVTNATTTTTFQQQTFYTQYFLAVLKIRKVVLSYRWYEYQNFPSVKDENCSRSCAVMKTFS